LLHGNSVDNIQHGVVSVFTCQSRVRTSS